MAIQTSTLRPGILVSLSTSMRGKNVAYRKLDLESEHVTESGMKKARWETTRVISDPAEFELAGKVRHKTRNMITSICAQSAFGLLCPETSQEALEAAIKEARKLADEFNASARLTRVNFYVMCGRIAPDDVEAVRAINSEVRNLLSDMEEGLKNLDVKKVREAANQARNIGQMLSPDAQARITIAIEAARATAKKIVAAGEQAAQEVDLVAIRRITESRTAFLDLDEEREIEAPVTEARGVDLTPSPVIANPVVTVPTVEL